MNYKLILEQNSKFHKNEHAKLNFQVEKSEEGDTLNFFMVLNNKRIMESVVYKAYEPDFEEGDLEPIQDKCKTQQYQTLINKGFTPFFVHSPGLPPLLFSLKGIGLGIKMYSYICEYIAKHENGFLMSAGFCEYKGDISQDAQSLWSKKWSSNITQDGHLAFHNSLLNKKLVSPADFASSKHKEFSPLTKNLKEFKLIFENMNKKSACGIIPVNNRNRKVLVGKRSCEVGDPGVWIFPGGKLEKGESFRNCAKREFKEETWYEGNIQNIKKLYTDNGNFNYHMFIGVVDNFEPIMDNREFIEMEWTYFDEFLSNERYKPKHPKLQQKLNDKNNVKRIRKYIGNVM